MHFNSNFPLWGQIVAPFLISICLLWILYTSSSFFLLTFSTSHPYRSIHQHIRSLMQLFDCTPLFFLSEQNLFLRKISKVSTVWDRRCLLVCSVTLLHHRDAIFGKIGPLKLGLCILFGMLFADHSEHFFLWKVQFWALLTSFRWIIRLILGLRKSNFLNFHLQFRTTFNYAMN